MLKPQLNSDDKKEPLEDIINIYWLAREHGLYLPLSRLQNCLAYLLFRPRALI